jgi:hypothetical protein
MDSDDQPPLTLTEQDDLRPPKLNPVLSVPVAKLFE